MIDSEAAERFMNAPWLGDVSAECKRAIAAALDEGRATAGAVLLEQGQPNDHLTFLIEGKADLERSIGHGRRELITVLSAPAVFGTTSFFQPKPPTATVRAVTDVWMLTLYHPAHERLRLENPRAAESLAVAVVRVLSERFDLIDGLFSEFIAHHSAQNNQATPSEWSDFRARLFDERAV